MAVSYLVNEIYETRDRKESTIGILDLSKVFVTVNHHILLHKLYHLGVKKKKSVSGFQVKYRKLFVSYNDIISFFVVYLKDRSLGHYYFLILITNILMIYVMFITNCLR